MLYLCVPLFLLHLLWRGRANPAYRQRWQERFALGNVHIDDAEVIWVHAVSVGEVQAALPLIRRLIREHPSHRVVVTTTTPTGAQRVHSELADSVVHHYMPYDLPGAMQRFLKKIRPRVVIVLETELWPNLFHFCAQRGVAVALVNVRLSARSALGYGRFSSLTREMLGNVNLIAAQTTADAQRLMQLGAKSAQIKVTGSIKFDARLPASLKEEAQVLRRALGVERHVLIAASTHEGEDVEVLNAFEVIRAEIPNSLLLLVPRHPERFDSVRVLSEKRGLRTATRTQASVSYADIDVFVGDTMGELPMFYAASDVGFVGGSLVPVGGHNLLEPAALALPIITGPHTFNFEEITRRLSEIGACVEANSAEQLAQIVLAYFRDADSRHSAGQKAQQFVRENQGAEARVADMLSELLPATC